MSVLLAFLLQVEPPTTVNGIVLGKPEAFGTIGPARICLGKTSLDLVDGEKAYLQYSGIHHASLRIERTMGPVDLSVGDSWADASPSGRLIVNKSRYRVFKQRIDKKQHYVFYKKTEYSEGAFVRVADISGSGLQYGLKDIKFLNKIGLHESKPSGCARQYNYGWVVVVGDELVSEPMQAKE